MGFDGYHDGVNYMRAVSVLVVEKARGYFEQHLSLLRLRLLHVMRRMTAQVGLNKIFVYFEAVVHESTILSPPRPLHCPRWYNTIARLVDRIQLPLRPPACILYTIQDW